MEVINMLLALMNFFAITFCTSTSHVCKKGSLECGGGSPGGAVFACKNGAWDVLMICRTYETCKTDPVPHCTWKSAKIGSNEPDPVPGYRGLPSEVPATLSDKNNTDTDTTEDATAGTSDSQY